MESNLKLVLENFQKSDCIIVSIMQSLMQFFKYDMQQTDYYAIGNGRILSLPFCRESNDYFRKCFAYVNDVCYFSGAWDSDFLTSDANGFRDKLKEKWFEWADMQQAMPIIIGLINQDNTDVSFYIMVGYSKKQNSFELINSFGEFIVITEEELVEKYIKFGFATIDVPYNFLVKSSYYRKNEYAQNGLWNHAGYFLNNQQDMIQFFQKLLDDIQANEEEKVIEQISNLRHSIEKYHLNNDLFRVGYGKALCNMGHETIGKSYEELGKLWEEFMREYAVKTQVDLLQITNIIKKEFELIKLQKGLKQ